MEGEKKFLDTVHGYISVPENYCDRLIDTVHFQRLRRIEQSSARSLFPCARHDRFIHSLGVFHIGKRIYDAICQDPDIRNAIDDRLSSSYQIACLLHDCGHSPFSHTLEKRFGEKTMLFEQFVNALRKRNILIPKEWENGYSLPKTKHHEIISAYLCVKVFGDSILHLKGDLELIGRMIMGLPYKERNKSLENCFISLLNGKIIDADKLEYICRDQWALGYLSNSVDVDRLISGIRLYKDKKDNYEVVFKKNSITEIQAVVDSKNFQLVNVFKHHQVVYEQYLFGQCINELEKKMGCNIFDFRAIEDEYGIDGLSLRLLSDDDIVHLLKTKLDSDSHLKEWLSRDYKFKPLWKSRSDFIAIFKEEGGARLLCEGDGSLFANIIVPAIRKKYGNDSCIEEPVMAKMTFIRKGDVKICFDQNNVVDFTELRLPFRKDVYKDEVFNYLFVDKKIEPGDCIKVIRDVLKRRKGISCNLLQFGKLWIKKLLTLLRDKQEKWDCSV